MTQPFRPGQVGGRRGVPEQLGIFAPLERKFSTPPRLLRSSSFSSRLQPNSSPLRPHATPCHGCGAHAIAGMIKIERIAEIGEAVVLPRRRSCRRRRRVLVRNAPAAIATTIKPDLHILSPIISKSGAARSSARFNCSTLTLASPRKPNWRPSVFAATNWRTASTLMPRAAATRAHLRASCSPGLTCGSSPAAGGRHSVGRQRAGEGGVLGTECLDVGGRAIGELLAGGAEVGTAGGESVIAIVAGGRGTSVEIARLGEALSDPFGAHGAAVGLNQAAIGLMAEESLGESGDDQRVKGARDHREQQGRAQCNE